jgi:hypothetical protein
LLTIGTKIEMIFASRLFTGGIINRFRADEYTIHDDEGEMTAEFHKKMEDFYRDVVKANRPQIPPYYTTLEFPMPKPRGNWRFSNVEKLGSTGYWLHQAWDVEAEGSLEARCCKEKCWIRNRDIRWLWYDDIDANSYLQLIKTQHPMWYVPIEGSWDIIGDKLLNTDFKVKVLWQDNRANEKQIIPCFNKN